MVIAPKTFFVEGAVDFRSGTARIGKAHIVERRQEVYEEKLSNTVSKMREKNRISIITPELVLSLKNSGLSIEQIASNLNCDKKTVLRRINALKE